MRAFALLVALSTVASAEAPADAAEKEMALLDGEWEMVAAARDGETLPDDQAKTGRRVAKDGASVITVCGVVIMESKYSVDPGAKPKAIDLDVVGDQGKGVKLQGIYELDGDTLRFCLALPGRKRPTDFTAKEGSGRMTSSWKRKAK